MHSTQCFSEHPTAVELIDIQQAPYPNIHPWEIKHIPGAYGKAVVASVNGGGELLCLAYTVNFTQAGQYTIYLRGTGNQTHDQVHLHLDSVCLSCRSDNAIHFFNQSVFNAYSTYFWNWVNVPVPAIQSGMHTLRLYMVNEGVAVDQIVIARQSFNFALSDNIKESRLVKPMAYTPPQHYAEDTFMYWVVDQTGGIASAVVSIVSDPQITTGSTAASTSIPTTSITTSTSTQTSTSIPTTSIPTSTSQETSTNVTSTDLASTGLAPTTSDQPPAPVLDEYSSDSSLWIIIGSALGALIICVLIIVLVVIFKKRANRRREQNRSTVEMQQPQVLNRSHFIY
jgi:hypothetical protein